MPWRSASLTLLIVLPATVACTDTAPSSDARTQISDDLRSVLAATNLAVTGTRGTLPRPESLTLFARVLGSQTPLAAAVRSLAALAATPPEIDVDAAMSYVNDRVLGGAIVDRDGTYHLPPTLLCADDAACAAQVARLDLRLRATPIAEPDLPGSTQTTPGLRLALELGASHDQAATITLTPAKVDVTLDLDVLQHTLGALTTAVGANLPSATISGQLTAKLHTDPTGASILIFIDRPIAIRLAGASGDPAAGDAFVLTSAAGKIASAVLSQTIPLGDLAITLGGTTVELTVGGKRRALDLAGLSASASFDSSLPLLINDIGLGGRAATISVDGVPAETVDINPDDGHQFNVIVQRDDGVTDLQVVPKLDLRLAVDHAVLGDPAPAFDITRVLLDGKLLSTSDRLEVATGSFSIATDPASHGFTASPGQCVTTRDAPLAWTVGSCP